MSLPPSRAVATLLGVGYLPLMPGTFGALVGLLAAYGLWRLDGTPALTVGALFILAVGIWAADAEARASRQADPSHVVIDEMAGQMLACLILVHLAPTATLEPWALAFVLFRFFDIVKPWPIGAVERLRPVAIGIMADDVLAGIVAGLLAAAFLAR